MNTRFLIFTFLLFISKMSIGQELPVLIPNSPEATEFIKHGNTSVSMYTATPNINIPIYTIQGKEFSLPISLSYDAGGIKVNQIATQVGLAWSLQAGGMISRITNGKPDHVLEPASRYSDSYYTDYDKLKAFYQTSVFEDQTYQPVNPLYLTTLVDYFQYEEYILSGLVDTEPDYFLFNVGNISGTIYIDPVSGEALCNNGKNYKISYTGSLTNFSGGGITKWHIIDELGNQYFFDKYDTTKTLIDSTGEDDRKKYISSWQLTKIISANNIDIIQFNYVLSGFWQNEKFIPTAASSISNLVDDSPWLSTCPASTSNVNSNITPYQIQQYYLSSIALNGKNIVTFYQDTAERKDLNSRFALNKISLANSIDWEFYQSYFKSHSSIDLNNITAITQDDIRLKLDSITIKSNITNVGKKSYEFDYFNPNNVPNLQSFSQDYWGFYNGKSNNNTYGLVPSETDMLNGNLQSFPGADRTPVLDKGKNGTLSKITYPTGGFTEFDYELHKVNITEQTIVNNNIVIGSLFGGNDLTDPYDYWDDEYFYDNPKGAEFIVPVYESGNKDIVIRYHAPNLPHGPGDNDPGILFVALLKCTGPAPTLPDDCGNSGPTVLPGCPMNLDWYDIVNYTSSEKIFIRSYPGGNYPTAIADGYNETVSVNLDAGTYKLYILNGVTNSNLEAKMSFSSSINQTHDKDIGGLRIKTTKDFDTNSVTPALIKQYTYTNTAYNSCGDPVATSSGVLHYNPIYSKYTYNTKKTYESGSTLSTNNCTYLNRYSHPLNVSKSPHIAYSTVKESYVDENGADIGYNEFHFYNEMDETGGVDISLPFLKSNFKNGNIVKQLVFDNSNILKQKTVNTFSQTQVEIAIQGYRSTLGNYTEDLKLGIINYVGGNQKFKMYEPGVCGNFASGFYKCYAIFFPSPIVTYGEPFTNKINSAYTVLNNYAHINETITTNYFGTDSTTTKTNYYYDGLTAFPKTHRQVSRTKTITTDGKTLLTKTYYPDDVINTTSLSLDALSTAEKDAINTLKTLNRTATPIQSNNYLDLNDNGTGDDNELLSSQRTNFKDLGGNMILPEFVQTLKGAYHSSTNKLEDYIVYHEYDSNGNPLEVSKKDGTKVCYIWGYDGRYPLAKIEHATYYPEVSFLQGSLNLINLSNADDSQTDENALRVALDGLRSGLPNALVSTYTYDPLIGITSITDPSGYTTYYVYDNFNRLAAVKDANGNILSETEYNYKQ